MRGPLKYSTSDEDKASFWRAYQLAKVVLTVHCLSRHILSGIQLEPSHPLHYLPALCRTAPTETSFVLELKEAAPHLALPTVPRDEDTFTAVTVAMVGGEVGSEGGGGGGRRKEKESLLPLLLLLVHQFRRMLPKPR